MNGVNDAQRKPQSWACSLGPSVSEWVHACVMIAKGGILHSYMFGRAQLKLQCVLLIHRRLDDVSCARVCVCVFLLLPHVASSSTSPFIKGITLTRALGLQARVLEIDS